MTVETAPARAAGTVTRGLSGLVRRWVLFVACLVVWQLITVSAGSSYFPPPLEIVGTAWQRWIVGSALPTDVLPSVGRLVLGWAVAALVGVVAGMLLGRSRTAMAYVGPLLSFARAVPPPALVPVFLVLFGIGFQMQVATIVFGSIWPILLNSADGARSVDVTKAETARAFRINRWHWFSGVVLPSALPKVFAGLRISLSLALIMMVISELVGTTDGIGYSMQLAKREFDYPQLWAGIVLLGLLGYVFNAALLAVEKRVLGAARPNQ